MQCTLDNYKIAAQDSSVQSYKHVRKLAASLYKDIIQLYSKHPYGLDINETAYKLRIERSTASARINELRSYGVLKFYEKRKNYRTNKTNNYYILSKYWYKNYQLID